MPARAPGRRHGNRIAVLSGDPGATARPASGLQDRFAEEAAVVHVAAAAPPVRFMLARPPRRVDDRIIIRRPDAIDGDGMNSLPAARRLRKAVHEPAQLVQVVGEKNAAAAEHAAYRRSMDAEVVDLRYDAALLRARCRAPAPAAPAAILPAPAGKSL